MDTQTKFSDLKSAVAEYQLLGWRIMPVNTFVDANGEVKKVPACKNWTDPNTVFDFSVPHNAIGLITGKVSNRTVVDIDTKNGINGFLTLERMGIILPDTVRALTPTGGHHLIFEYCPEVSTNSAVLGDRSGVDIRNDGGFIVLTPSQYPEHDNYQWLEGQAPGEIEISPFPKELLDLIKEHQAIRTFKPYVAPEIIQNGHRNDTLFKMASSMRNKKLGEKAIEAALQVENLELCRPPLSVEEVSKIVQSVSRYPKGTIVNYSALVQINAEEGEVMLVSHSELQDKLGITKTSTNQPICNVNNAIKIFSGLNELKEEIWFDEFHNKIFTTWKSGNKRELTDAEIIDMQIFIQGHVGISRLSKDMVFDAVLAYARQRTKNEPKDWLESLDWDKTPRIERLFIDYFGAEDSEYIRAASKNFMISLPARIYRPGCKVDNMPVLEGAQGTFKSTGLQTLIGEDFYCDANPVVSSKEFCSTIQSKWLIEIAELSAFSKIDVEKVKQVVTRQNDRFRTPYDRLDTDHLRQCVFAGTTNDDAYLKDPTGGRRFWPIRVGFIDINKIKADRAQLFAEAVKLYKEGVSWWEMPESAAMEQEARRQTDAWEDSIRKWLMGRLEVTSEEVAVECLKFDIKDVNQSVKIRISNVLKVLGWENKPLWKNGKAVRTWVSKKDQIAPKPPETLQVVDWED